MALLQEKRLLSLKTPLGDDVLLLTGFRGREEISRLFRYELDMISDDGAIAAADIVGKNVTFSVKMADDSPRFFNGFVSRFVAGDEEGGRRNYRAEVVPWLWFLTQTADCRIFQNMRVPEIIEKIFGDLGFSDFDLGKVGGNHKKWEYCVQYRETDFNFVSRLMEQEGIYYYFKHEDGAHKLVLADSANGYHDCVEKEVECPRSLGRHVLQDHITHWEHGYAFRPGKWAHTDYDFKKPGSSLMARTNSLVKLPGIDKYEIYDYPGEYVERSDGDAEVKVRMEEEEAAHDVVTAAGTCKSFTPGGKFTVTSHRSSSEEGKPFVITAIQHAATEPLAYETGGAVGEDYSNSFTCIPASVTFRPARTTPKPLVSGVQTAVVVGPAGEEIFCDEFGRVKVQFHWDREGKKDDKSSCWIRTAHNIAGKNWGFVAIPRIGQEVVVDFLEGDPDRPLIVGSVYNAEQMPPYELPANKTQTGIKTRSSKEGDASNFNEIRFEDKKGDEQLFIHAEKNQDIEVENDETLWVGHDRTKNVDHNESTTIGNDRRERVKHDESIQIDNDRQEDVKGNEKIRIGKSRNERVGKDEEITIDGSRTTKVGKDEKLQVDADRTTSIGKDEGVDITGARSVSVGKNDSLNVSKELVIEAGTSIIIKSGDASITLKKNGDILIKGKNIALDGSGKINIEASSDVKVKGSKIGLN